ncbi:DDB1- and CUL4-associated factor 17 [Collichthys lucidus]|uniref:DDB1-and CUL4-associated factor 17 n=1 Tax=Collichthys lucidus TaxID=240159 RepID=A0A4V6AN13_COLLU|nr:DDB1- and CUL4-associated factor 17 [Collichthys lucidus]
MSSGLVRIREPSGAEGLPPVLFNFDDNLLKALANLATEELSETGVNLLMAPYQRRRAVNAAGLLERRSRGIRDAATIDRNNMKILRAVLLQDNRNFLKVWSKTSKSTIMYENGKIYFENYQNCYSCVHSEPQLLYKLPKRSKLEKFEDALLCLSPLDKTLASPSDHKPSLLVLTADNWLYRLSAETGEELQRVYLSSNHKFRYLSWDVSQEMFYVKSVQNKETSLERQAGITQNTVMHLAIFHVFPLRVVGILEINKKVFGNGVTDVILSQGVLVVSYSNKSVKLYSFEHITQRYLTEKLTLGQQCSLLGGKTVGDVPFGIPVNIQITDCPPVLFEVSCSDKSIQIGGYPWHYIYTPPTKRHRGCHHICSLKDSTMATNGIQNMNCCSLESDEIFFHPDDSGRIIHVGPNIINVLKILGELDSGSASQIVKDFSMETRQNNTSTPQFTVTSSGRTVKRRFNQLDDDPDQETFRMLEYEDELDLLAAVVTNGEEGEGRAHIQLHDNQSGQLLRTVELDEPWDETYRHELFFNKDTIVHIEQKNTNFCCHVYKLNAVRK